MKIIYITILVFTNIYSLRLDKSSCRNDKDINNIADNFLKGYKKSFGLNQNAKIELVSEDKPSDSNII
jgi:hypothetical protein